MECAVWDGDVSLLDSKRGCANQDEKIRIQCCVTLTMQHLCRVTLCIHFIHMRTWFAVALSASERTYT